MLDIPYKRLEPPLIYSYFVTINFPLLGKWEVSQGSFLLISVSRSPKVLKDTPTSSLLLILADFVPSAVQIF